MKCIIDHEGNIEGCKSRPVDPRVAESPVIIRMAEIMATWEPADGVVCLRRVHGVPREYYVLHYRRPKNQRESPYEKFNAGEVSRFYCTELADPRSHDGILSQLERFYDLVKSGAILRR